MKLRWTSVAWSAVYLLLLLSLATPLTVVTIFSNGTGRLALHDVVHQSVYRAYGGRLADCGACFRAVPIAGGCVFIIPAIVMGYLYKKEARPFGS